MAHGHGAEPPAHSAASSHGHSAEVDFDVIPEGSPQDKLLVATAVLALILLFVFAYQMLRAPWG